MLPASIRTTAVQNLFCLYDIAVAIERNTFSSVICFLHDEPITAAAVKRHVCLTDHTGLQVLALEELDKTPVQKC